MWEPFVRQALAQATISVANGDPPFGAVLLDPDNKVVSTGHNCERSALDPTGHAEVNALRVAAKELGTIRFPGYTFVGNAEPCSMCASMAIKRGIYRFVFGAPAENSMEPFLGIHDVASAARLQAVEIVGGVLQDECIEFIRSARTDNLRG